MNWFTVILVFHILRLNLCVAALNQVCPERQFLNASGVCVDCTVCKPSDKKFVLRQCSANEDTLCGAISNINISGIKVKPKFKNDISNRYLTINTEAELSKENITEILKKFSNPVESLSANEASMDASYYYYYDDEDLDEDEYEDYDNRTSTTTLNSTSSNLQLVKKTNKKTFTQVSAAESTKKQPKKNAADYKSTKPIIYSMFPDVLNNGEVSVIDPDTLIKKTKNVKKFKLKESTVEINDHSLKIGDTKFKIGDEKPDDGRWLQLSHPHMVNRTIYVDLAGKSTINKKGSTFFSSAEKLTNEEYVNEMGRLLNATSAVLSEKRPNTQNHSIPININQNEFGSYHDLKNLDDIYGNDDDDDDDDEDEDDEDGDEDEDIDDDNGDEDDDGDEPSNYNDVTPNNSSDKTDSVEKSDFDTEDDYDLQENDFYQDRSFNLHLPSNDIIAEPFVSPANWQILILVAAMSACLLFFIVISAYVCIYMSKRRHFKTTLIADVEDLSVHVNLMQHAAFETDDSSNIKNYITHLRSVKSISEKLPKAYIQTK